MYRYLVDCNYQDRDKRYTCYYEVVQAALHISMAQSMENNLSFMFIYECVAK